MGENNNKMESLISAGSDIAGAAVGGALGFIAGGPAVAAGAGVVGVGVTRVLRDVATRFLSSRETARVGATASIAISSIQERLKNGEKLRSDNFFETRCRQPSSAEEIFEGTLLAAKNTHEEKKALYLGYLFSNVAFDITCTKAEANHLIHVADSLTYTQFILLHLFSASSSAQNLRGTAYGADAQVCYATISTLQSIHELCNLNLLIMQGPNESHHTIVMGGINIICPQHLKLAISGNRLHKLLGLSAIPQEEMEVITRSLR
ncbi:MAG: hypothetical protein IT440_04655 [Phycisphaeraceae bacterium]|nr:hypothetical protein [Phycisphaeraceae bacterium]